MSVEQQAPEFQIQFDPAHINDQAEAGTLFGSIGERFGRPFSGYAYDTYPGLSQRKSPSRES
jgi:hypothetical protein